MNFIYKSLIIWLLLGLILPNITAQAQETNIIKGKVISASDKLPLVGATVVEMDKDKRYVSSTITDANGRFVLKVSKTSNIVVVSFIGYKSMEFPASSKNIEAALLEESFTMTEVQVVAKSKNAINTGIMNVDELSTTASFKKIDTKEIQDLPSYSIDDALQGRIAGVDIVSISGDPGAGSTIKIRNASSLSGSTDPLIVIDGIPVETRINNQFNLNSATSENFAQILNISPEDIKEIAVFTDAATTALYGTRASNGVILINTKTGTRGKVQVNYSYRGTMTYQPDPLPMLNGDEYATLIPEAIMNYQDRPMDLLTYPEFKNDPSDPLYHNYNKNTNWIDAITQQGIRQDHNLSFNGGGEKAQYRLSLNYFNEQGTTIGTGIKRYTANLNVKYIISDKLWIYADLRYNHIDNDRNFLWLNRDEYNVRSIAYKKMPNMSIYEYDQYGNQTPNYFSPQSNAQGQFPGTFNPVAMAKEAKNKLVSNQIIPTFKLNYTIARWLNYSFDVRYSVDNYVVTRKLPKEAVGAVWYNNYNNMLGNEDRQTYSFYARNTLTLSPNLGENHKLTSLIASEVTLSEGYWFDILGSNSPSTSIEDITTDLRLYSGQISQVGTNSSKYKMNSMSGIGNVTYAFKDKYILNGSLRLDLDPKFGEDYQRLLFGGVGARWRISAENFMKSLTFINDFSLRANWGINGNSEITSSSGRWAKYNSYNFTYLGQTGIQQSNPQLFLFRPEEKTQTNLGFNLFMIDNRINVDVNFWFEKLKSGFRRNMQIPTTSGYYTIDANIMEAHNNGVDIDVKAGVVKKEKVSVDLRFNISRSQNIPDNISSYYNTDLAWTTPSNGEFRYNPRDNTPLGSIFGLRYKGVYKDLDATIARDEGGNKIYNAQGDPVFMTYNYPAVRYTFQPGDAIYEDVNKDGNINYNDVVYLGNSNPLFTGGFGSTCRYKNLFLDMYFYFRYKFKIVNMTKYETENMTSFDNQSVAVLRRWRNPGDETDIPRAMLGTNYNSIGSDRFLEDGSFIRLKTITLNYALPKKWVNSLKIKDARVYITATNLLTFTNYSGQDPEVSIRPQDERLIAEDNARTPRSKEFTLGINVGF